MAIFFDGAIAFGYAVAGLFFLRFWRDSREALFGYFAVAFWMFAINYAVLGLIPLADEKRPYVFVIRLIGFAAILWGIAAKNRSR
jgi:Family of unknown function (DUF5985)